MHFKKNLDTEAKVPPIIDIKVWAGLLAKEKLYSG